MANSIIYSGGDGGWSNNINKIIYSGPITNANIIYNNWTNNNWTKYNSINVPNNRVGGVQYKNKNINKWANGILKLINKWTIKYINNKINWTKYNLKNINNKGIRIGPTHNIKFKKYNIKN